jgi:perosamine synthetase
MAAPAAPTTPRTIRVAEPSLTSLEEQFLLDAYRSTFVSGSLGPHLSRFEQTFSSRVAGCAHGVAVCNGTVAIHLLLKSLDVQPGEEVLLPDFNYVANAAATVEAGAVPVLVDCDAWGRIDPEAVRAAAKPGVTRFLWVVHLYGLPCDMDALQAVADDVGLTILEDCAEAHGALYKGKTLGSFGLASTYSFFANKIITTGEGGMLCTNDADLAQRARHLSRHAMSPTQRFFHTEVGYNYRLSNLLCAIGCAQVERFDEIVAGRRALIEFYRSELDGIVAGVHINPQVSDDTVLSPWLAYVLLPDRLVPRRDDMLAALRSEFHVDTRPFFYPMHTMPPYAACETATREGRGKRNAGAVRISGRGFNIPTSSDMSLEDRTRVVEAVAEVLRRYAVER